MAAEVATATAEDKARYEQLKKELLAALPKKRATDKQLVSWSQNEGFMFPI